MNVNFFITDRIFPLSALSLNTLILLGSTSKIKFSSKNNVTITAVPSALISLASKVEEMVKNYDHLDIKVAVMGCVVNGPGEAKEADLGIAGGIGEGLLIKKGEILRKVPEEELLNALKYELDHWK